MSNKHVMLISNRWGDQAQSLWAKMGDGSTQKEYFSTLVSFTIYSSWYCEKIQGLHCWMCVTCRTSDTYSVTCCHPANVLDISAGRGLVLHVSQQRCFIDTDCVCVCVCLNDPPAVHLSPAENAQSMKKRIRLLSSSGLVYRKFHIKQTELTQH